MANVYPMPARPADTDPMADKVTWLVQTHGFDARADKVVMLFEPSASCTMTVKAFKEEFAAWSEVVPRMGARGPLAPKLTLATDLWSRSLSRVSISGVRMHPGRDFPVYVEDGQRFKNTYRRPVHVAVEGADIQPFVDFMDRFLPAEIDRNFWLDWMTHKWRKPEIPGTSPWFVADTDGGPLEGKYGTGRGFMARILHKLYGEAYCKAEDFDILTGTSAQAVYTDWQANNVLVTVDEAHTSPTSHRRGEKRSVYTALKHVLDPAPKRRSFKIKNGQAFDGVSFCSVTVATNHANAAAIPVNDRRVTVLRNGREMTPAEARAIDAWIEAPGSMAALVEYLESSDLSQFDMFTPMKTDAKDEMAELAKNDVEHALADFASDDDRGRVFPKMFLERALLDYLSGGGEREGGNTQAWRGQFAGAFDEHCAVVKLPSGNDKAKIRVNKQRYTLYAFRSRMVEARGLIESERREHAAKWYPIDDIQTVLRVVPGAENVGGPDAED
jgi:hypothetical protein